MFLSLQRSEIIGLSQRSSQRRKEIFAWLCRLKLFVQISRGSSFFFTLLGAVSPTKPIAEKADQLLDAAKTTEGGI
jgi:hypothetical protein